MKKTAEELHHQFERILLKLDFTSEKAKACADIFTSNSVDGVYSHGINRFPVFVDDVKKGWVNKDSEPQLIKNSGVLEQWDGLLGPGMLNAKFAMKRAIDLAKINGMACLALKNTNHWMRGGTYGWQAADAGCISISFTNTIAIMPPWGAKTPTLGNNPLVIAIPRPNGHLVLDMALSQFSYGKMQSFELNGTDLPFDGGYDHKGQLTKNPKHIKETQRTLPIGFWKGSGLALILDILATILSEGNSSAAITKTKQEKAVSQVFICFDASLYPHANEMIEEILTFTKAAIPIEGEEIYYPGESTLKIRKENTLYGIPVEEKIWDVILAL